MNVAALATLDASARPGRAAALLALLRHLAATGYRFVTISPASHRRVLARDPARLAATREDVLGWSRAFAAGSIDPAVEVLLAKGDALAPVSPGLWRSALRVSTIHDRLFLHSAYPTDAEDAVFLGPDSLRFADLVATELHRRPVPPGAAIIDIGTGAGVGAIVAAGLAPGAAITMTDINPLALELARINAAAANFSIAAIEGCSLAGVAGPFDVAIANPPFVIDARQRAYRDGGAVHGSEISLRMTRAALAALRPGGRFILYTGSAIVGGVDRLEAALAGIAAAHGCTLRYREIDPDVFGEELGSPAYADVDRIAVVAGVMTRLHG